MRDPIEMIASALQRDRGGVAIVWYPDPGVRDWLLGEVRSVAVLEVDPLLTDSVEDAIRHPDQMVMVVPADDRQAVLELDASRDRLLDPPRAHPVVLFLLRGGEGQQALAADAPSLWGWTGGSDADPELCAEVDLPAERAAFLERTGNTPEAWLGKWRGGQVERTPGNLATAYRALLLEQS